MADSIMAVIGICGGLLCAVADCLLDLKGVDNKKLGKGGYIDSKWKEMANWRFVASDIVVMFAVPMYTCGFLALMNQFTAEHIALTTTARVIFLCGAMGGFMIHTFLCLIPIIYKDIMELDTFTLAEKVISDTFKQIYVPFITLYCMLVILPAGIVIYAIAAGIHQILIVYCAANFGRIQGFSGVYFLHKNMAILPSIRLYDLVGSTG